MGKTTRPIKYDLNQIPYDYTVEVRNGLEIRSERVPEQLWTEVHNIVGSSDQNQPQEKERNAKKQNGCLRKP